MGNQDPLCYWLGGGDAQDVIARLAQHNVEITNTSRYGSWLASAWDVRTTTRMNVSTKYFPVSAISHQDLAYLQKRSPEDRKLYDLIEERLTASGRTSVRGEELL